MKITFSPKTARNLASRGWALLAVLTITAAAVMLVASVISWSNENATVASRRNEYFSTSYAAEAATEKALAAMMQDDNYYGEGYVMSRLSTYSAMVPSTADNPYFANFTFSGGTNANRMIISMVSSNTVTNSAPYTGMISQGFTYEIIANAQNTQTAAQIPGAVGQKVVFSQIPMFQFAVFYMNDMEINPGGNMTINGPVHGNGNVYLFPNQGVTLTLSNDVSSSFQVLNSPDPLDPSNRGLTSGTLTFDGTHVGGVIPLDLPSGSGTNNLQNGQSILALPTSANGGSGNAALLYNQAQMIVMISNSSVTVTSGTANNQATVVPTSQSALFISTATNSNFYDQRDGLPVNTVKLDIGALKTWVNSNTSLGVIDSIYIADMRSTSNAVITTNSTYTTNVTYNTNQTTTSGYPTANYSPPVTTNTGMTTTSGYPTSNYYLPVTTNGSGSGKTYTYLHITGYTYGLITSSSTVVTNNTYLTNFPVTSQPGIVLTNGATLPSANGLAVASPDPVYVIGNWNVSTNGTPANLGTANTSQTFPSAIFADAITVLSPSWANANSTANINSRNASDDTVNAAFFTGNVPSNGAYYSGGVENFPRFLENWSGHTFTYNGSMVEAFFSQLANYPWPGTGTVYNPPTRNWAFDQNFKNPQKLPPLTPRVVHINRSTWALLPPNTTSF